MTDAQCWHTKHMPTADLTIIQVWNFWSITDDKCTRQYTSKFTIWRDTTLSRAFFHCQGKGPTPYNFGENSVIFSLKGNEKTWRKVTFWGKLHVFKEIFWGEGAQKWPLLKKEKKPCSVDHPNHENYQKLISLESLKINLWKYTCISLNNLKRSDFPKVARPRTRLVKSGLVWRDFVCYQTECQTKFELPIPF